MSTADLQFARALLRDVGRFRAGEIEWQALLVELELCKCTCSTPPEWMAEFAGEVDALAVLGVGRFADPGAKELLEPRLHVVETLLRKLVGEAAV